MSQGNITDVLTRHQDQCIDRTQALEVTDQPASGLLVDDLVQSRQALEVGGQAVHQQRIQHVTSDPAEARERHDLVGIGLRVLLFVAHANDHQAPGTESHRRRQRRCLTHGTIAEVLPPDQHRREDQRRRDARHDVVERHFRSHAEATDTSPGLELLETLVERYGARRAISRRGNCNRVEQAAVDRIGNMAELDVALEQFAQRGIVQQRLGI